MLRIQEHVFTDISEYLYTCTKIAPKIFMQTYIPPIFLKIICIKRIKLKYGTHFEEIRCVTKKRVQVEEHMMEIRLDI